MHGNRLPGEFSIPHFISDWRIESGQVGIGTGNGSVHVGRLYANFVLAVHF